MAGPRLPGRLPLRPGHRLDLLLGPAPDGPWGLARAPEGARLLLAEGAARSWWGVDGSLPAGGGWPEASLRPARVEVVDYGSPRLIATEQGGVMPSCPTPPSVDGLDAGPGGAAPLAARLSLRGAVERARAALRNGGDGVLDCPVCAGRHALWELRFAPPASFGAGAFALRDVDAFSPPQQLLEVADTLWGGAVLVPVRRR